CGQDRIDCDRLENSPNEQARVLKTCYIRVNKPSCFLLKLHDVTAKIEHKTKRPRRPEAVWGVRGFETRETARRRRRVASVSAVPWPWPGARRPAPAAPSASWDPFPAAPPGGAAGSCR